MRYDVAKVITFASISPSAKSSRAEPFLEPLQAQVAGMKVMVPRVIAPCSRHIMSANRAETHGVGERLLQVDLVTNTKKGAGGTGSSQQFACT